MILLLGSTGYVGSAFQRRLEELAIPYRALSRSEADYSDYDALVGVIRESQASFLVNSAGYTGKPNVDAAEKHKSECLDGNAVLPGTIRAACETTEVPWGHVSSGCLYTGRRDDGGGFTEDDTPNFCFRSNNCSWYSGSKALGEEVLAGAENTFVWRLRIPFGRQESDRNYLSKVMRYERLLQAENSLSHLDEFAAACIDCWRLEVPFGTYNVTNTGSITTRRVTELIQEHLLPKKKYSFFANETEFMRLAATTPRSNCVLDNSKLLATGVTMSHVEDAVVKSLQDWQPER